VRVESDTHFIANNVFVAFCDIQPSFSDTAEFDIIVVFATVVKLQGTLLSDHRRQRFDGCCRSNEARENFVSLDVPGTNFH